MQQKYFTVSLALRPTGGSESKQTMLGASSDPQKVPPWWHTCCSASNSRQ